MTAGVLADRRSFAYSTPGIVKVRNQNLSGSQINTTFSEEMRTTLTIPADWQKYDLEASFSARGIVTGTISAPRAVVNELRLGTVTGSILGRLNVAIGPATPANQVTMSFVGFREGETTTGTVVVMYAASIAADANQVSWDVGTLITTALRTA